MSCGEKEEKVFAFGDNIAGVVIGQTKRNDEAGKRKTSEQIIMLGATRRQTEAQILSDLITGEPNGRLEIVCSVLARKDLPRSEMLWAAKYICNYL